MVGYKTSITIIRIATCSMVLSPVMLGKRSSDANTAMAVLAIGINTVTAALANVMAATAANTATAALLLAAANAGGALLTLPSLQSPALPWPTVSRPPTHATPAKAGP